jgi:hypothetical protein
MRKHLITLMFAAIGALAFVASANQAAAGSNGAGDAREAEEQAQMHPTEANQAPDAVSGGIAEPITFANVSIARFARRVGPLSLRSRRSRRRSHDAGARATGGRHE